MQQSRLLAHITPLQMNFYTMKISKWGYYIDKLKAQSLQMNGQQPKKNKAIIL
ncbi:MAG: hypothetical protein WCF03_20475 [Nitrososphaeraceae archaeon]